MISACLICQSIAEIKAGTNPYFVKELETGYVVIGFHQFYKGYTLFFSKVHVSELHEMEPGFKVAFLNEMSLVAEAVHKAFKPLKLNYELLGNSEPHCHWHLFPRHADDPNPTQPVWAIDKSIRCADAVRPSAAELVKLKDRLLRSLAELH